MALYNFLFLILVNCKSPWFLLRKIVESFPVAYSTIFEFRVVHFLDCLTTKTRGASLSNYFMHSCGERDRCMLFSMGISTVESVNSVWIWTLPSVSNFHANNHYTTCTSIDSPILSLKKILINIRGTFLLYLTDFHQNLKTM